MILLMLLKICENFMLISFGYQNVLGI